MGIGHRTNVCRVTQQQRMCNPFLGCLVGRPDDHGVVTFGEHDAPRGLLRPVNDFTHDFPLRPQAGFQALKVDGLFGH